MSSVRDILQSIPPIFPAESAAAPMVVAIDHTEETRLDTLLLATVEDSISPKAETKSFLKQLAGAFGKRRVEPPVSIANPKPSFAAGAEAAVVLPAEVTPRPFVSAASTPAKSSPSKVSAGAVEKKATPLRSHETPLTAMKPEPIVMGPVAMPKVAALPDLQVVSATVAPRTRHRRTSDPGLPPAPGRIARAKIVEQVQKPESLPSPSRPKRPAAIRTTKTKTVAGPAADKKPASVTTKTTRRGSARVRIPSVQAASGAAKRKHSPAVAARVPHVTSTLMVADELSRQLDAHREKLIALDRQLTDLDQQIDLNRISIKHAETRLVGAVGKCKRLRSVRQAHARFVDKLTAAG